jgi:hypothetical protein
MMQPVILSGEAAGIEPTQKPIVFHQAYNWPEIYFSALVPNHS